MELMLLVESFNYLSVIFISRILSLNIQMTYYGETNIGRIRKNDEDAFIVTIR